MGIEQDACAFDAHIILIWNEVIMGMEQEQTPHKRRVRYKGKYPKKYEEKYKELQPDNPVRTAKQTADGCTYLTVGGTTMLLGAPKDISEFRGTIIDGDTELTVNVIGAHAFDGCKKLEYVSLPKSVSEIGTSAFDGCTSLSGVMIEGTGAFTIKDHAFDGCTSLRFIGSNAMNMTLENDYNIVIGSGSGQISGELWCPTGNAGYNDAWRRFDDKTGITGYLNYGLRPHVSIATLPGMAERTIVVNGFSKSYAMTGWRLGYACGPEAVIKIMTKIHQSAIMSAPTTSQYAAITALKECDGEIDRMRDEYNMRRRLVVRSFNDMGLTCFEPRGAFYAFPCIKSTGMSSQEFCTKLLEQKHVAIIPGDAFGASGEGYCRVSYAYSVEHLTEALKRIREFLVENNIYHGN